MPQDMIKGVLQRLEQRLLGKRVQLEYALATFLTGGHLLIEDVPGVGKTTLAKSLARCFDVKFNRIQFTSDLLPSDLTGVTVYSQNREEFHFQPGPIFTNVLLTDEINRANPKTQSALLEAMHEGQVSHDLKTMPLPRPFFVVATLNSKDHHGTFPLPESQLDRFLVKLHLGYPDPDYEKSVIQGHYISSDTPMDSFTRQDLLRLQEATQSVFVFEEVLEYILAIVAATRSHPAIRLGVSPRGGQALFRASKGLALVRGRDFVIPQDVREMAPLVCAHRIALKSTRTVIGGGRSDPPGALLNALLEEVPLPK